MRSAVGAASAVLDLDPYKVIASGYDAASADHAGDVGSEPPVRERGKSSVREFRRRVR